jgi:uncharacterized protein
MINLRLAMSPQLEAAVRLQNLDQRIGELEREVAALPRHIAAIEKTLESHIRKLEVDRAALAANTRERKKLEGDIQVQEQKISKLRDQMLQAKTNEQYKAFQHEIEYCQNEIRKHEDRILDLMGESEPLDGNVKAAEVALKKEKASVEAEKKAARERTAEDQKALAEATADRAKAISELEPKTYQAYLRIRKKWNGTVVADATEGRCTACQIVLRPQFFQDLRRGEEMMFCESCGRILFYNPPVAFDQGAPANSAPPAGAP